MASVKDYLILRAIGSNKSKEKGTVKAFGTTVKEIVEKTDVSRSKVSKTLKDFIELGYVEEGLTVGNAKSYIVTAKGMQSIIEVYGGGVEDLQGNKEE